MSRPSSATSGKDFADSYIDILRAERRLVPVTTRTCPNTGTYLFLKLFKKGVDDEFYLDQRVTLTASQIHQLTNNKENVGI